MTEAALLEVENVTKVYMVGAGVTALQKVSLAIPQGVLAVVTGPSGCGKSTLLHLMGGLDRPTFGDIRLAGTAYSSLSAARLARVRRQEIGFIFQQFHLVPELLAWENVALPMFLMGKGRREAEKRARHLLQRVGLAGRADHYPYELSGGEQQRVAAARALANEPRILLADEPTGNLDSQNAAQLLDLLEEFHRMGQTLVIATHDPYVVERAQWRIHLKDGQLREVETFP
ncbi:MAG: ABC transporter ATP-binding protein [Bacillota bacterium]|nr:ABC transporter ATP-binding protein [Bacillota bacterium]